MTEDEHRREAKKCLANLVQMIKHYDGGDKFITYGNLARNIDYPQPYKGSLFGKRIGKTLGTMGHLLDTITAPSWEDRIPYIQAMVVAQNTKLPSDGLKEFIVDYPNLSTEKKKDLLYLEYQEIFRFGDRWDFILEQLGIGNPSPNRLTGKGGLYNPYGSEGSPEHRNLVQYISEHPEKVGFDPAIIGFKEFPLKSKDCVDVLFLSGTQVLGVEVKSKRSGPDDHLRGIFQCIKYRAILKSEDILNNLSRPVDCVLVHEEDLNASLKRTKERLQVRTIQIKFN